MYFGQNDRPLSSKSFKDAALIRRNNCGIKFYNRILFFRMATVFEPADFDPSRDAEALEKAMRGLGKFKPFSLYALHL